MALTRSQREYQECSLMCFTEPWLHQEIPNDNVSIDGYETVQGLSILVNNRWFSPAHITVKEIICCPDMELLDSNHLICLGSFHILSWWLFTFLPLPTQRWCVTSSNLPYREQNHLQLNVTKTKVPVMDLKRTKVPLTLTLSTGRVRVFPLSEQAEVLQHLPDYALMVVSEMDAVCCPSHMSSWTMAPIHSMMWWSATGVHSALDCPNKMHHRAPQENHSCLWPSNCSTPH